MAGFLKINAFGKILLVLLLSAPSQCAFEDPPGSACNISELQRGNCSVYNYLLVGGFDRCLMNTLFNLSWVDMENHCRGYGGHLVKITNKQQNDALDRFFRCGVDKIPCKPRYAWIGLHKTRTGYRWISDNSTWTKGVDFSKLSGGTDLNKCFLWEKKSLMWTTDPCTRLLNGICMEDLESFPRTPVIKSDKPVLNITNVTVGDRITVECHAFVGVKGKLEFMIQNVTDNTIEPVTKIGTVKQREDFRVDCTDKCSRFVQAKLVLKITKSLDGKKLVVLSGTLPHLHPCSEKDRLCLEITSFSVKAKPKGEEVHDYRQIIIAVDAISAALLVIIVMLMLCTKDKKSPHREHGKRARRASKKSIGAAVEAGAEDAQTTGREETGETAVEDPQIQEEKRNSRESEIAAVKTVNSV